MQVILAWGQKKRHIAVDGKVLCQPKFSNNIRQRGETGYNSLTVSGIPTEEKTIADDKYTHTDGIIPSLPLHEILIQGKPLVQKSICAKCKKIYGNLV